MSNANFKVVTLIAHNFEKSKISIIIILDPDDDVRSNDTLVDTPFQLISGFFHVNQGVLRC